MKRGRIFFILAFIIFTRVGGRSVCLAFLPPPEPVTRKRSIHANPPAGRNPLYFPTCFQGHSPQRDHDGVHSVAAELYRTWDVSNLPRSYR